MNKGELELIDYAIYFATKAHNGQKRKTEQDVEATTELLVLSSIPNYDVEIKSKRVR